MVSPKKRGPWLRTALDGSGPVGIKLGQFISNRPDIFGTELSRDLAPLRDQVTPIPFSALTANIPPGLTDVDPLPLACASIAQVHRAKLKDRSVVIKFKRPGAETQIKEDLALIRQCTNLMAFVPALEISKAAPWFDEFEKGLLAEVDFKTELKNISIFREIYRDRDDIQVPRPYSKFSNDDVIVMDYIPSKQITAPFTAERLINMFLDQLLYEGVIHGDLHTGNVGQAEGTLVLYDFGNVIRISPEYKSAIRDFVYGVQTSNIDECMINMERMGMTIRDAPVARIFVGQYLKYLETLDLKSFSVSSEKFTKVPVELDSTTLTILRSYTLLEGLAKEIDPYFSYEKIISKAIETLFLDLEYIMYRIGKDSRG
jgi:predicted unusual protein kinase regulating ubiquinone biosynthesis (AarF/ABC1/UbiB family)